MRRLVVLVAVLAAAAAGLAGCAPRPHHVLEVSSGGDGVDAAPGDGVCEATGGAGEDLGATGDLDLDVGASEVRVEGGGHRIDAAGLDRAFDVQAGTFVLDQVVVAGGRSVGPGGGMRTAEDTATRVLRSTFVDNRSLVHGACTVVRWITPGYCVGDGLDGTNPNQLGGTNPTGGGAISNAGQLGVVSSTFEANAADSDVDPVCVVAVPQWATCAATWGGAIASTGDLFVGISTFAQNDVVRPPDADTTYQEHFGAAIHASGTSQIVSSTVVDDWPVPARAVVAATVQNSIVLSPMCGEPTIDADRNLRSPAPCDTPAPSGLGPLADNGGPTRTALPDATSPAIGAIPWEDCLRLTVDQRGEPRVEGQPCDVGAVERRPADT